MLPIFGVLVLLGSNFVVSYEILGLFPFPGKSHHVVFDSLMVELANRGHRVTVYNTFPKDSKIPNYQEVSIEHCFKIDGDLRTIDPTLSGVFHTMEFLLKFLPSEREILSCEPLIQLLNHTGKYDLLITEMFNTDFFQLFGQRLGIPVIVFHSSSLLPWMSNQLALPDNPSYIPHAYTLFPVKLNFLQRLENTIDYAYSLGYYKIKSEYVFDEIARTLFGPSVPPLREVVKNISLCLVYTHVTFNRARPLAPKVVEVGGLNIKKSVLLPKVSPKSLFQSHSDVLGGNNEWENIKS